MIIRIVNVGGNQIVLSPSTKFDLNGIGLEAEKINADWEALMTKILRALERDGFDLSKLQPEIKYYDTKNGRKILSIKVYCSI
jgi:hypothetical protein